ncbi:MAG: hypothetical protein WKG06_00980 [Segetibacter sp.]
MKYGYCDVHFWRPTGLGNRLFSWARAKVFSKLSGNKMLAPIWGHIRGGSIIRGGINYNNALRKILLFDNFKSLKDEIGGIKKFLIKEKYKACKVKTIQEALGIVNYNLKPQIITFVGHTQHNFEDLVPYKELINEELKKIAKTKWINKAEEFNTAFIGINVRMGRDFKSVNSINEFKTNNTEFLRTPPIWYIDCLRKIREIIGEELPEVIISDGTKMDLQKILEESNVSLPDSKSAISDLLILSKAQILIGSGRSSFSAWASFLGKMPTVTIPGSNLQSFKISTDLSTHYVGEFNPDNPSLDFIEAIIHY